jgi:hypothetical protein
MRLCIPQGSSSWVRDPRARTSQSLRVAVSKADFLTAVNLSFPESRSNFVCGFCLNLKLTSNDTGMIRRERTWSLSLGFSNQISNACIL